MSLNKIGRIPLLSKPSMSLKIGLRLLASLSRNKQTPSVEIARDDYLTIVKQVIAATDQTKNVLVSPPSVHVALCQCTFSSSGSTRAQLLTYLKSESVEHLVPFYSHIVSTLLADGSHVGGPHLSIKAGIWADLVHNQMVVAHTVCFKGIWSEKFDAKLTTDADFHLLNGTAIRAPFMTSQYKQRVGTFDGFKVLKLPYNAGRDKRRFSMYIYLPDAKYGVPSLIERISSELGFIENHLPHEEAVTLDEFRIPKFKIDFNTVLHKLGVVDLFEKGIAEVLGELLEGEVLHRSLVVVNEVGTESEAEAEAVTVSVGLGAACPIMDKKSGLRFVADHPFVITIREDTSGIVLFVGQLLDPLDDA